MKRLSIIALALIVMVACDDGPTAPSNDNEVSFTASLLPANEVPPVTNADAGARGTLTFLLELERSGGAITSAKGDFTMNLTGFPAGTTLTGAHIHKAAAGTNAGVLVNLGLGVGEIVLVNGAQVVSKNEIPITAADAQDMINNPSGYYFNVHSQLNPGGAIRAQLTKQ
jgi:hypothetical protein